MRNRRSLTKDQSSPLASVISFLIKKSLSEKFFFVFFDDIDFLTKFTKDKSSPLGNVGGFSNSKSMFLRKACECSSPLIY